MGHYKDKLGLAGRAKTDDLWCVLPAVWAPMLCGQGGGRQSSLTVFFCSILLLPRAQKSLNASPSPHKGDAGYKCLMLSLWDCRAPVLCEILGARDMLVL